MTRQSSKILRVVVFILLGMTAVMTLLGGIGTTCIAFNAGNFGEKWAPFLAVAPLMQVLVVVSIAAALFGVYATVRLGKGWKAAYFQVLAFLLVGGAASAVQYYLSATLRNGSTAPNSMRLYITGFTLLVFLALRLPGVWQRTGFGMERSGSGRGGGAGALIVAGLITMTTPAWAMPTHLVNGYNTANELLWVLLGGGAGLIALGMLFLLRTSDEAHARDYRQVAVKGHVSGD